MSKKSDKESAVSVEDKKVVKGLADGMSIVDMPSDLKLSLNARQVYARVDYLKILFQCANLTHLVATFIRKKIIK